LAAGDIASAGQGANCMPHRRAGFLVEVARELVRFSFIWSDQRDDLTAFIAVARRLGRAPTVSASFNRPFTSGRIGARITAATAAMNLDPLQQARGAHRKLLVGFLDRSLPTLVFPLIS
jgi:hypothetical protein